MTRWLIAFLFLGSIACANLTGKQDQSNSKLANSRELYSWRDGNGDWCFSLIGTTNRPKTAEEIFDKDRTICGVATLKRRISEMRGPAWLVWMKDPWGGTAGKGTESVVWPPTELMNEVKRFAATKHIEVIWSK